MSVSKSRADYFKERRKSTKSFYAEIDAAKMDELQKHLDASGKSKRAWLEEKIDEELAQK